MEPGRRFAQKKILALATPKIGPVEFVAAQKFDMPTTLRNRTCDFLEHRPWGGSATKRPAPKDATEPAPAPFESPPTKPPPFRPSAELTYEGTASSIEEDPSTPGLWTSLASLYLSASDHTGDRTGMLLVGALILSRQPRI